MAIAARTRQLATHLYLTNGTQLLYVLDLPDEGQAVIEDAKTNKIKCVPTRELAGWRVVEPEQNGA